MATPWSAPPSARRIRVVLFASNSPNRDAANRITGLTETGLSPKTFGYDALDRVTNLVQGIATISYSYDANGNRTQKSSGASTSTYTCEAKSNRLLDSGGLSGHYTYDAAGNPTSDGLDDFARERYGKNVLPVRWVLDQARPSPFGAQGGPTNSFRSTTS